MFSKSLIDNQIDYYKYIISIPLFIKYFDGDITYHEYYSYNSLYLSLIKYYAVLNE